MNQFLAFIKQHLRIIIGVTAGVVIAVLMLTIGFWPTLLIGICAGLGALFASNGGAKQAILRAIDKILPRIFK